MPLGHHAELHKRNYQRRRNLKIARGVKFPIIASGGVATLDNIRKLLPLEKESVEGVPLYVRAFHLREALVATAR